MWFGTDIGVVPSTEPEAFGMVAIEAMAAGVPVVAAGHGGLLDIVIHEKTGLIFSPGNTPALTEALERLASSRMLRHSYGAAGTIRQQDFFSLDLFRNLNFKLNVVYPCDQVKSQPKTFPPVAITISNNFKTLDRADDIFVQYTFTR